VISVDVKWNQDATIHVAGSIWLVGDLICDPSLHGRPTLTLGLSMYISKWSRLLQDLGLWSPDILVLCELVFLLSLWR
jgi:hypothetical protein